MNSILKLALKKLVLPKIKKLVDSSSNKIDDKFYELLVDIIENYL